MTILIFLLPLWVYGQDVPIETDEVWSKEMRLYCSGKLDSVYADISFFIDRFNKFGSPIPLYIHYDTIRYNDSTFAVGLITIDPFWEFDYKPIGSWTHYYPSGKIYASGEYSIGAYTECSGGPMIRSYAYKIGLWKYWHENGVLMAEGIYKPTLIDKWTGIGEDKIYVSYVTEDWKLFDESGVKTRNGESIISRINNSR